MSELPRLLLVADEPMVLEALSRQLRREYEITCASGAAAAMLALAHNPPFDVIVSDLRMPGMDGVALLERCAAAAPDTSRVLLTGYADAEAAIDAVNKGQIFRFLTKPCPPSTLRTVLAGAVEQRRLVTAERVLLQETLHGAIRALIDTLALANPLAFGHANRARHMIRQLAERLGAQNQWEVEVAAMLSQIAIVSLPQSLIEKVCLGATLDDDERVLVSRLPAMAEHLLAGIPRLEGVRDIIRTHQQPFAAGSTLPLGARILRVVLDFDALEAQGRPAREVIQLLTSRAGLYDPSVLDALRELYGVEVSDTIVRELPLRDVEPGMRFIDDIRLRTGMLLIPRGYVVNAAVLERIRTLPAEIVCGAVKMIVPRAATS
jgi:response regulator RpfG family c-di-GMP phosphodiesterase